MPKIISRKEARELGLKWYFTGKACKHGHTEKRRTSSAQCIGCYIKNLPKRNAVFRKRYRLDPAFRAKHKARNKKCQLKPASKARRRAYEFVHRAEIAAARRNREKLRPELRAKALAARKAKYRHNPAYRAKIIAQTSEWQKNNRDKVLQIKRKFRERHAGRIRAQRDSQRLRLSIALKVLERLGVSI